MLLKITIKCHCVKNKGGIIYEKMENTEAFNKESVKDLRKLSDVDDVKMLVQWMQLVMG